MNRPKLLNKHLFMYITLTILALLIRSLIPQNPRIDAVHDDSLMVQLAFNILQGNWLGEWNQTEHPILTLFKPSGYPIFLAVSSLIGVSPIVCSMFIYLISSAFLIKFGFPGDFLTGKKIVVYGLFAFNPAFYGDGSSLVYRDIMSTAVITSIIAMCFYALRVSLITKMQSLIGIPFGLILGLSALLKDDIKYLGFLGLGFIIVAKLYKVIRYDHIKKHKIISLVFFGAATLVSYLVLTSSIKYLNYSKYGVFLVEDNNSGNFPVLLSTLGTIETKKDQPDLYVSKFQIQEASENSPTFKLMMPYFESDNLWKQISCNVTNVCDQSGVFFMHELRDAMYYAGLANSAKSFQLNSKNIADELKESCSAGGLQCDTGIRIPGIYMNIDKINRKYVIDSFFQLNKSLFNWEYIGTQNPTTLEKDETKTKEFWAIIPGIKWDYQYHPISEAALGLTSFKKILIWVYQIISMVFLVFFFVGFRLLFKSRKKFSHDSSLRLMILMYLLANVMMVLTNVAGWNSFNAGANYFLIFSPYVVFFYGYIYLAIRFHLEKV